MTTADIIAERDSLRRAAHALEERVDVLEESLERVRNDRDEEATERRRTEGEREYERGRAIKAETALIRASGETPDGFRLSVACADCGHTISILGESMPHAAVMLAHQASIQFTTDGPRVVCRPCASKTAPKEAA